jgi:hypothetical protein
MLYSTMLWTLVVKLPDLYPVMTSCIMSYHCTFVCNEDGRHSFADSRFCVPTMNIVLT